MMQRFFTDFASIQAFTRSLPIYQSQTQCKHCLKHDQFVSHGLIYKQHGISEREAVGKRLLCSNRYGRTGCGRTVQLRIAHRIDRFHYSANVVSTFIVLLLAQVSLSAAYQQATGQFEPRNAWRWLQKLTRQLSQYRSLLKQRIDTNLNTVKYRSKTLSLLLPTLAAVHQQLAHPSINVCAAYQQHYQRVFM